MAPLFSKVDLNKLWHDVQNEETLICAKFGKDLFNISKVIGRKKVAEFFFDPQCISSILLLLFWFFTEDKAAGVAARNLISVKDKGSRVCSGQPQPGALHSPSSIFSLYSSPICGRQLLWAWLNLLPPDVRF